MPAITLQLRSGQAITFSPQLQRAVRLLQMSSLEYTRALHDTAEANPFLELELEDGESAAPSAAPELFTPTSVDERSEVAFAHFLSHDESFDLLQGVAIPGSLRAHLHDQIGILRLSEGERVLADAIVESLDDDGYLRMTLEEIGGVIGTDDTDTDSDADGGSDGGTGNTSALATLQTALWRVQTLDPPGVGARDVQECLTLQLPSITSLELRNIARRILKDHIALLASRNDRRLALELGAPLPLVQAAMDCIRKFNPRPGWQHEEPPPDSSCPMSRSTGSKAFGPPPSTGRHSREFNCTRVTPLFLKNISANAVRTTTTRNWDDASSKPDGPFKTSPSGARPFLISPGPSWRDNAFSWSTDHWP